MTALRHRFTDKEVGILIFSIKSKVCEEVVTTIKEQITTIANQLDSPVPLIKLALWFSQGVRGPVHRGMTEGGGLAMTLLHRSITVITEQIPMILLHPLPVSSTGQALNPLPSRERRLLGLWRSVWVLGIGIYLSFEICDLEFMRGSPLDT